LRDKALNEMLNEHLKEIEALKRLPMDLINIIGSYPGEMALTLAEMKEDSAVREAADAIFNPQKPLNHITDMLRIHRATTGGSSSSMIISFDFKKISEIINKLQELSMKTFGHVNGFNSRIQALANLEINATYNSGWGNHTTLKLRLITDLAKMKSIHEGNDERAKRHQYISAEIFMPVLETLKKAEVNLQDKDFGIINIDADSHITVKTGYRFAGMKS
jgi:hypothetical protein